MKKVFSLVLAGVLAAGLAGAGETAGANPYRDVKPGDWTRHEGKTVAPTADAAPVEAGSLMYSQVTEKTDDQAVVARVFTATVDGQAQSRPPFFSKIDLKAPHVSMDGFLKHLPESAKVERLTGADETVQAAGKAWNCKVEVIRVNVPEHQMDTEIKLWSSAEAPLSGMVRMDMKVNMVAGDQKVHNDSTLVLSSYGTATNPDPNAPSLAAPDDDDDDDDDAPKAPAAATGK